MVDRTSGVPAFRQVAADLRERIAAGQYTPGSRLPSERELVDTYGVSRPTIRDAVNMLRAEGIVTAEHGRGAFMADAAARGWTPSSSVKIRFEPADDRVAECLGIQAGDEVTARDRVMRANGLVVQLAASRLPRDLTHGNAIEQIDTGIPVVTVTRIAHGKDRPLEMNDMVLPADRFELSYEWPAD
ncbi:GntR family transcriptional regulator [Amycolatopsis cihanbeyliensis]|uniref:GntR family transcriptional regulator n=1 Tax=Amycolatopsis cihanbeyliensis TaxID=1128664 RepID=A0A542DD97_AMYCI|nr:GntR family transcriptional regulator [Amycolatopsis cihanbeyliensis]TQJ01033.1 GntR family transcriptional regulator [Amycolatopsis cihanbeyliensis]